MATAMFNPRKLAAFRVSRGLTQMEFAVRLRQRHGIKADQGQVARWEAGMHTPRASVMPALAAELGCSMDELFGGEDEDEDDPEMLFETAARALADHGEYDLAAALQREVTRRRS